MGIEEQKEEREILESIYPDEITGSQIPIPGNLHLPNYSLRCLRDRIPDINRAGRVYR